MRPPELLSHVRSALERAESVEDDDGVRGLRRGIALVFRFASHSSAQWTQLDVGLAGAKLSLALRQQTEGERAHIAAGRGTDVQLGDRAFDDAFIVESAPADVVRELLDAPIRRRLLALRPFTIEPLGSGFRIEKSGWVDEAAIAEEMIDLGAAIAERVPASLAHVETQRFTSYRVPRVDAGTAADRRDAEIAAVVDRTEARKKHNQLVGCMAMLAVIAISLVLAYCLGAMGAGVDPNDPAFP
jgi:hypothetical protein